MRNFWGYAFVVLALISIVMGVVLSPLLRIYWVYIAVIFAVVWVGSLITRR